jgi:hypothetical protein
VSRVLLSQDRHIRLRILDCRNDHGEGGLGLVSRISVFVWRDRSEAKNRGNDAEMERRWSYADSGSLVVRRWELWAQTRGSNERGESGRQISLTIVGSGKNDRLGQTYL